MPQLLHVYHGLFASNDLQYGIGDCFFRCEQSLLHVVLLATASVMCYLGLQRFAHEQQLVLQWEIKVEKSMYQRFHLCCTVHCLFCNEVGIANGAAATIPL
jgi:hypothetical protein